MPNQTKKIWRFMPLLLLLLLAVFLYRGLSLDPQALPSALLNRKAPALNEVTAKMRGQAWLLNVWATWCQACRSEHPILMDIAKQGIPIVGLDYKDQKQEVNHWLSQFGNPYKQLVFDGDGRIGIEWGVYGAPETFIIDKQGIIRYKHVGAITPSIWHSTIEPIFKRLSA